MEDSGQFSIISFSTLESRAASPTNRHRELDDGGGRVRSIDNSGVLPTPRALAGDNVHHAETPLTRESSPVLQPPLDRVTAQSPHSAPDSPISANGSGRGRTHTNASTTSLYAYSTSSDHGGSSDEHDDLGLGGDSSNLLMPSMRIGSAPRRRRRDRSSVSDREWERRPQQILILGKTSEQRTALARLLDDSHGVADDTSTSSAAGDDHMSASFCSVPISETDKSTRPTAPASPYPTSARPFEPTSCHTQYFDIVQPSSGINSDDDLCRQLATPLERLEAMIDTTYPSSTGLLELVMEVGLGDIEAAIMLLSSPPTASEVTYARSVSQVLPLIPVLILPPSPTARPQKTSALVHAVSQQLTSAGVRWKMASCETSRGTSRHAARAPAADGLYLLPHDALSFPFVDPHVLLNSAPGSNPALTSLSSSQELIPPSPTFAASRSSSSSSLHSGSDSSHKSSNSGLTRAGDLRRLRTLLSTRFGAENLRQARALSFLDWREAEIAARGGADDIVSIEMLPASWRERRIERVDSGGCDGALEFSKRVAERRVALSELEVEHELMGETKTRRCKSTLRADVSNRLPRSDEAEADADDQLDASQTSDGGYFRPQVRHEQQQRHGDAHSSSILTDLVATPRPALPRTRSTSLSSSNSSASSSSSPALSSSYFASPPSDAPPSLTARPQDLGSSNSSLGSGTSSCSTGASSILLYSADPFHLPSLLQLVGLNIRLALLPALSPSASSNPRSSLDGQQEQEKRDEHFDLERNAQRAASASARSGWVGTVALCGIVFLAGVMCGSTANNGAESGLAALGSRIGFGSVRALKG